MEEKNVGAIAVEATVEQKPLKLDYGKTFKVGFAFAIIMLFWTAYDFVVPLLLENAYGLSNAMRGFIMGLDNLLSLFMLPLFGKISDRSKGKLVKKFGRRTPFIVIGTIASVVLMVFVPLSARSQQIRAAELREDYLALLNDNSFMEERLNDFYDAALSGKSTYCDLNYLDLNGHAKGTAETREFFVQIRFDDKLNTKSGFLGIGGTTYEYDGEEVDKDTVLPGGKKVSDIIEGNANYNKFVAGGMNTWISEQVNTKVTGTAEGRSSLAVYMVILLLVLVAMATFRSPAVALMPDVTPKPLRSQANAVINLCGGAGGAIAFLIYTIVLFGNNVNNYIIIFGAVAGGMLFLLAGFLALVREKKMVEECRRICEEYGIEDDEGVEGAESLEFLSKDTAAAQRLIPNEFRDYEFKEKNKNPFIAFKEKPKAERARLTSFFLILASIFMWFMGYNAVSSSLSVYATKALNLGAGVASIISGASMGISAIAFIPVGFLAVKIGRRKSIMVGFALAVLSFVLLFLFVRPDDNQLVPAVLFALFYLIAGFGLIIANVNTFPMVTELAKAEDVGRYTGYYYVATMSAQAITPFIAGLIMDAQSMNYLFLYSAVCVAVAIVLMIFVKHGDSKQIPTGKKMSKEEKKQVMLDSMDSAD